MFPNPVYYPQQDSRSAYMSSVEEEVAGSASTGGSKSSIVAMPLTDLRFAGRVFELNTPIQVSLWIDFEDAAWACGNEELSILAFGRDVAQAIHSFSEDFDMLWSVIAQASDDSLTPEAQAVKRAMRTAVKKVIER